MNTIDDLGHPLILETAKNLAWKQVGLGFCKPQDQDDLAQDLLLYLCRQFSRYTGALPLVTWACRLLRGRINTINRRLLGVPSPSEQRRMGQTKVAALSPKLASSPATEPERSDGVPLEQVATKQEPAPPTLPERSQAQTVVVFRTVTVPPKRARMARHNPERLWEKEPPDAEEPPELNPSPQPENPVSNARSRPRLLVLCTEVGKARTSTFCAQESEPVESYREKPEARGKARTSTFCAQGSPNESQDIHLLRPRIRASRKL